MESAGLLQSKERTEKPPRLQWFEQQAKKLAKQEAEEEEDSEEGKAVSVLSADSLG